MGNKTKKVWEAPAVISVDISKTEMQTLTGTDVDGYYLDHVQCFEVPAYS